MKSSDIIGKFVKAKQELGVFEDTVNYKRLSREGGSIFFIKKMVTVSDYEASYEIVDIDLNTLYFFFWNEKDFLECLEVIE